MTQLAPDQAEGLRRLFSADMRRMVGVLASSPDSAAQRLSYELAAALAGQGRKVLLLDESLAAGECHPASAVPVKYDFSTLLMRPLGMGSAITVTAHGVALLAGGGAAQLQPRPRMEARIGLVNDFYRLAGAYDVVLIAAGGQLIEQQPSFVWACQDVIVLCERQPDSVTKVYGHIKSLQQSGARRFHLLFEKVDPVQAATLFRNVAAVCRRHLQLMPEMLGILPTSDGETATFCRQLAMRLDTWPLPEQRSGHFPALMRRLLAGNAGKAMSAVAR